MKKNTAVMTRMFRGTSSQMQQVPWKEQIKSVANSSSITGQSEADLDFSELNESQQNYEKK